MRERCSPAVDRAIHRARACASATDSTAPDGPALLSALLEEADGRAAGLLHAHGVSLESVMLRIAEGGKSPPLSIDQLLAEARLLSRECDAEGTVTSEFFLLALLRMDHLLREELVAGGLRHDALEREIVGEGPPLLQMEVDLSRVDEPDRLATGRVLDVNANRARESLRILDDFCRFVLDDAFLTHETKRLRHDLAHLLDDFSHAFPIAGRETVHDVGTSIGTAGEMDRESPSDVARINLKRLQESLRSLEEFGKVINADFAQGIEQLRYRAYTLEKAMLVGKDARSRLEQARICVLLTGAHCVAALDWTIAEAAAAGASMFQLREKDLDDRRLLERAGNIRKWTRQANALFIVNDRPDIARLADADGVHLGQDDMTVRDARRIVGAHALIGVSTHNIEQVRRAVEDGASYIGIGPTFPSSTKNFTHLAGLDFVAAVAAETSLPAYAIGGVNLRTIDQVVAAGASRIAVSAAVCQADDPRRVVHILKEALAASARK